MVSKMKLIVTLLGKKFKEKADLDTIQSTDQKLREAEFTVYTYSHDGLCLLKKYYF